MPASDPFDPARWAVTDAEEAPVPAPTPAPRKRRGRFIKGPLPLSWVKAAGMLPGKALVVGMMLWFESGMKKTRTVIFPFARAVSDGIPKSTVRRAIRGLEEVGLIAVVRKPGRRLEVTILDAPSAGS